MGAMSPSLSTFTTFMNITGPSFLTGPDQLVNEAVKQTYLLGRFLRDADLSRTLQGGTDIRDSLMFDEQSTAVNYSPNATFTPTNPQVVVNWKAYWRYQADHMSWSNQEIELQVPKGLTAPARHQIYKRIKWQKEQRFWTSMLNFMEDNLWRVPVAADMEAETGTVPYSIPAFINEFTNGLFYSGATPTGSTAWTTKQGLSPATYTKWKTQGAALPATPNETNMTYDSAAVGAPGTGLTRTLLQAFDQAWAFCNFQAPPTRQQYFENATMSKQFICCSFRGQQIYVDHLRRSQDTLVTASRQDPAFVNPAYAGIDVLRIQALNSAALYPDGATGTNALDTEMNGGVTGTNLNLGPRYYFINGNYLCPVFHSSRYMVMEEAQRHRDQPFTWVQYGDTWYNVVARSLQRHALVSPYGNVFSA